MTAQQEPEYIVTGTALDIIERLMPKGYENMLRKIRSHPRNLAPQKNQILVSFKDRATVDYILLVSRRKGHDLGDYIEGNFEWDDMLPCVDKINPEDCQFCDFRESCPDCQKKGDPEKEAAPVGDA